MTIKIYSVSSTGVGGGAAVTMGPEQNVFTGADKATAEAARDAYALANAAWLAQYDANNLLNIRLDYDDGGNAVAEFQSRDGSAWRKNESAVGVKGAAGSSASVDDTAFGPSWDGVTGVAPSKNSVYDEVSGINGQLTKLNSYATATDPALNSAITTAVVDGNAGIILTTTTTGNNQSIAAPTDTTAGKCFMVGLTAASTDVVKVDSTTVQVGQVVVFTWDGAEWINDPTQDAVLISQSTGWISGCDISINVDPTKFDVSAGVVCVMDTYTDPNKPVLTTVAFGGVTGITPANTALPVTALAIDATGSVIESNNGFTGEAIRDNAVIGSVGHPSGGVITTVNEFTTAPNANLASTLNDLGEALGTVNVSGNVISANGPNLKLDCSAGSIFRVGVNAKDNAKNPNEISGATVAAFPFFYTWRNGVGGFEIASATDVLPGAYDDGTGGVGTPNGSVGNNEWSIHRVFVERSTGTFALQFGTATYGSKADAIANIKSEPFDKNPALRGWVLRSAVIVKGNATDLSNLTDADFVSYGKFGDDSAAGATTSTTTLQSAYDNSAGQPKVLTDAAGGAVALQRGSAADTDFVLEARNGAGTTTFSVDGNGLTTASTLTDGTITVTGGNISGATSVSATSLTGTLQTAAQPNITSVGTLSALAVTGTVTHTGTSVINGAIQGTGDISRTGNATLTGNLTIDTNTFIVDSVNDRVGINKTPDSGTSLDVKSLSTSAEIQRWTSTDDQVAASIREEADTSSSFNLFDASEATAVRILSNGDSYFNGGNVLIGKATTPFNLVGINLEPDGNVTSTRSGSASASFNRLTNDGDIVQFFQDTSEIGSIGSSGTNLYIGANNIQTITMDSSGNVGIRTSSPSAPLDLLVNGPSTDIFRFGDSSRWQFKSESDTRYLTLERRDLGSGARQAITIDGDTGNIGLGTTETGGAKLAISSIGSTSFRVISDDADNGYYAELASYFNGGSTLFNVDPTLPSNNYRRMIGFDNDFAGKAIRVGDAADNANTMIEAGTEIELKAPVVSVDNSFTIGGRAGLGTDSPVSVLDIRNTSADALGIYRALDVGTVGTAGTLISLGALNGTTATAGAQIEGNLKADGLNGGFSIKTLTAGSLTDKLTIADTGNVGINDASPLNKLSIAAVGEDAIKIDGGADFTGIQLASSANSYSLRTSSSDKFFIYDNNATSERITLNELGYLGINKPSPNATLDVGGETRIYPASGTATLRFGEGTTEKGKIAVDNASNMTFETAGQTRLTVGPTGVVAVANSLTVGGNEVKGAIKATGDLNAATGGSANGNQNYAFDVTVTGAVAGDCVAVNMHPTTLASIEAANADFTLAAVVKSANTVRVFFRVSSFISIGASEVINIFVN